jgi:multisubunit Na+/H+ antiporter MnhF subunit
MRLWITRITNKIKRTKPALRIACVGRSYLFLATITLIVIAVLYKQLSYFDIMIIGLIMSPVVSVLHIHP